MKYKPTILIADDSKTFAMYFSILLGRMGFDVIPVENGEEACKLASVFKPDIITLDTEMPVMDGVTALRHIKEDKTLHSLPVVMLTTNATNDMVQNCMKLGCNGYLTKPVNIHKLHDMLQNCLVFPHGKKRKYLRSTASKKVFFSHSDTEQELEAISISEGGVFVRTKDLLRIGTKVGITLAFDNDAELYLQGTIIYTKDIYPGGLIRRVPGMGIAFDTLNDEQSEQLRDFILQQLAADIIEEQEEPVITLD